MDASAQVSGVTRSDVAQLAISRRWVLLVLCLGTLMVELDETIVNVALPAIKNDLAFSDFALVWTVNSYLLGFAGQLLLGARLGDLYGHGRVFLVGIVVFTGASLAAGMAHSQSLLIGARAFQGIGGAVVLAVTYSLTFTLFLDAASRATVLGVLGLIVAGARGIALVVGGALTSLLSWHWIFLINVPVGLVVLFLGYRALPLGSLLPADRSVDIFGAVTLMLSIVAALYALLVSGDGTHTAFFSAIPYALAAGCFAIFVKIEANLHAPLVPLDVFRRRNVVVTNVANAALAAAMLSWYFVVTQYFQLILKYSPFQAGLALLPANAVMALCGLAVTPRLVARINHTVLIVSGLLTAALGLALFARVPVNADYVVDLLIPTVLVGLGVSMSGTPLSLAAIQGATPDKLGLLTGVICTTSVLGGAVGLAVLAQIAARTTESLLRHNAGRQLALNGAYHRVFLICALLVSATAVIVAGFLRGPRLQHTRN